MKQKVAILGASNKPDRYAHMAQVLLRQDGHEVFPVTPRLSEIDGVKTWGSLAEVPRPIDTLTMYVGPGISAKLVDQILELAPGRVIFNPGTENFELQRALEKKGIQAIEACTLVLLRTRQFEDVERA